MRKLVLIVVSVSAALGYFVFSLFRVCPILDVGVLGLSIAVCFYLVRVVLKNKRERAVHQPHITAGGIIAVLFVGIFVSTIFIRCCIAHDYKERLIGDITGRSCMSSDERKRLGVSLPDDARVIYYGESLGWLEQEAKLIAIMDRDSLAQLTKDFVRCDKFDENRLQRPFWRGKYRLSKERAVYRYEKYVDNHGAVTADVLVVFVGGNRAKLYMDIIYW